MATQLTEAQKILAQLKNPKLTPAQRSALNKKYQALGKAEADAGRKILQNTLQTRDSIKYNKQIADALEKFSHQFVAAASQLNCYAFVAKSMDAVDAKFPGKDGKGWSSWLHLLHNIPYHTIKDMPYSLPNSRNLLRDGSALSCSYTLKV